MNSLTNYKLFAIFVIRICLWSHILAIIFINVNESMTLQCIFCTKNKFLQSGILIQPSSLDLIIGFLLFSYSALTIRIVRIVFGNQKMNEYEYRIPLFGPNYSNNRIVWIIRSNTAVDIKQSFILRRLNCLESDETWVRSCVMVRKKALHIIHSILGY